MIMLIGESNPHGAEPHYALWPEPRGCAGWRLCHLILGMGQQEYLNLFDRCNLLVGNQWSAPLAREAASRVLTSVGYSAEVECNASPQARLILCGSRVAAAFGLNFEPRQLRLLDGNVSALMIHHPSGRCRAWNYSGELARTRVALREFVGMA